MASPALDRPWPGRRRPRRRRRLGWRVLPRTLFGRSLLIVVLPLLILQAVLAYVFYERHWETVTRWLALGLAGEVAMLVEQIERADSAAARAEILDLARDHLGIAVSLEPGARLAPGATAGGFLPAPHVDRALRESFAEVLERPFRIDTRGVAYSGRVAVYVQLDGGLLRVLAPRKRVDSTTTTLFMTWMVGLSLLLVAVAVYFLRRQVRPIRRLAQAADSFGKGRDVGDFKLEGAIEIRQAGAAFNLMRERILRHLTQRTEMLAAVSHDLRTPLTRMRLELEMLQGGDRDGDGGPRAEVEDLRADVLEMERLVESYLAFARGEGREAVEPTDLGGLLAEVAERAGRDGTPIELSVPEPIELPLRPLAFRRCITNLVDNARCYGRRVAIAAHDRGDAVEVTIDDDGPGIAPEHREEAFKPFYRIEGSRSPDTGGVGLGLAIARDIALAHGGDIALDAAPQGGLRAVVRLPY